MISSSNHMTPLSYLEHSTFRASSFKLNPQPSIPNIENFNVPTQSIDYTCPLRLRVKHNHQRNTTANSSIQRPFSLSKEPLSITAYFLIDSTPKPHARATPPSISISQEDHLIQEDRPCSILSHLIPPLLEFENPLLSSNLPIYSPAQDPRTIYLITPFPLVPLSPTDPAQAHKRPIHPSIHPLTLPLRNTFFST